jgi:predicted transcriptional regulator
MSFVRQLICFAKLCYSLLTHRTKDHDVPTKTIRISDEQAAALEAVAMADETTVSEIVRDAISERLAVLRKDKKLQARLDAALERRRGALDLLAK